MPNASPLPADASSSPPRVQGDGLMHDELVVEARYRGVLFGLELEFFTVDPRSLEPIECLDALAAHPEFGGLLTAELAREQIEITTRPCASLREVEGAVMELCAGLVPLLHRAGASLLPVPLYDTAAFTLRETDRFRLLARTLGEGFRSHAVTIAADQVNIGAGDEAQAFRIYNAVVRFLPELMAFSVASPFRLGRANGIASNRLECYDAALAGFPRSTGYPPELGSLADYARHLQRQDVFQHPSTSYSYARPMPHRGVAVEIRCLDKQPTIRDSLALVALCKALVQGLENGAPAWTDSEALGPPAGRFQRARREGLLDPGSAHHLLDRAAEHLEGSERDFLRPLYTSVRHGTPAARALEAGRRYGVDGAYRRIAEAFAAPIR